MAKNGCQTAVVQFLPKEAGDIRIGFTATKKIGNAVIRNKSKRRLRAAIDAILKDISFAAPHADIVLIARDTTPTCDWDKLLKDLKWCLKRLNIQ